MDEIITVIPEDAEEFNLFHVRFLPKVGEFIKVRKVVGKEVSRHYEEVYEIEHEVCDLGKPQNPWVSSINIKTRL